MATKTPKLNKTETKMFEDIKKSVVSEKGIYVAFGCYGNRLGGRAMRGLEEKKLINVLTVRAGLKYAYVELVK